ncbi:MAG TPA: glycosyltransferase family A protein [Casimicrobiaceae bacterium]|nr:glycosyltransferase family A protein [Casimicrobiaceae bacterium]
MPPVFSIVTTCKGRLQHLQRSLPTFLAQPDAEVIVVDYDCPEHSGDWVEANYPAAKVERVSAAPRFNLSRARNIGANAATAPWLVFCDADNLLLDGFASAIDALRGPNVFIRPYRDSADGPMALPFPLACECGVCRAVGGFDDALEGWGTEDWEFVDRLLQRGAVQRVFPVRLVGIIDHDDSARTRFYEETMQVSRLIGHYYARIKARYHESRGRCFTDDQRYAVYQTTKQAVQAALSDPALDALLDVTVPDAAPPWTARIRTGEARALYERVMARMAQQEAR